MNTASNKRIWKEVKGVLRLIAWRCLNFLSDYLLRVESRLLTEINGLPIVIEKSYDEVIELNESGELVSPSAFASTSPADSDQSK